MPGSMRWVALGGKQALFGLYSRARYNAGNRRRSVCRSASVDGKNSVVFLGTPDLAAGVLKTLLDESKRPESSFEISGVISQPGRPRGRGNRKVALPSPVAQTALDDGFVDGVNLLCPVTAKDEGFLAAFRQWAPDLCVTAAYGNILPQAFLDIPKCGTLNIHPSLLPKYRGAAPVNRALLDGCEKSGVTVAYTVRKMDAGPVLAQEVVDLDPDIQAPELLIDLFERGTQLLIANLPNVWSGKGPELANPQDDALATSAPKMSRDESLLDFSLDALQCHNKVRAFAGWPGTKAKFLIVDSAKDLKEEVEVKVLKTRMGGGGANVGDFVGGVNLGKEHFYVECKGGSVLEILKVQPPNSKRMSVRDYKNGLGKRGLVLP